MPNTDGSVVISVDMSVDEAEKELARLKKKIIQAESSLSETKYKKSALQKEFEEAEAAYEKLYQTARRDSHGEWLPADATALEAAEKKANDLREEMEKVDEAIRNGTLSLDAMKNRFGEVAAKAQQGSASSNDGSRYANAKENVKTVASNFAAGLKQIPGAALDLLKRGLSAVASGIKTAFSKGLQFVKAFGNGIASVAKGIVGFVSKLNVFKSMSNALSGTLSRLGTMIKQAFVFNVVTRGLNLLRDTMGAYLTQNTALMNAVGQLKSAFLTAFQPIYDAVVPILTTIINLVTRAVSAIASFIAVLFGTTARQAQSSAKQINANTNALEGESGALEDTAEAAEEAEGSLAGFDEINTITTENAEKAGSGDGGGGGAGGLDDAAALFDLDYEDTIFDSWGEAFSAMLDKMLGAIPRLREALLSFADSLNGVSQKVLDMFTFPGVKEKVVQLGVDLANAFNDLVAAIDWNLLGQALGAGLNLALLFLVNLIYTFDWMNLGRSLADSINGIVSQIDWKAFGELLWAGFKIGIEMLAGFLLGLDMTQIARAASNLATGFFDAITDTINRIPWDNMGRQVTRFVVNLDWRGVAASAEKLITDFFNAVTRFITSIEWDEIGQQITGFINSFHWSEIGASAGNMITNFLIAAHEFIANTDWGALAAGIIGFINGLDWKAVGTSAGQLVIDFFNALGDMFAKSDWRGLGQSVTNFVVGIDWIGVADSASNLITDFFNALVDFIASTDWAEIGRQIGDFLVNLDWLGIVNSILALLGNLVVGVFDLGMGLVESLWEGICSLAGWLWDQLSAWVTNIWDSVVGFFTGKGSSGGASENNAGGNARAISYPTMNVLPTNIQLPRLAQGAVIPPNREFMAVLGDQRNGNNLEAPESLIRSIVNERNDQIIERLDQLISAVRSGKAIYVDKKVLAKTAADGINEMTRISGKPVLLV